MTLDYAKAQQPVVLLIPSSNPSESYNTISMIVREIYHVLLNQIIEPSVLESMGNKSSGGVSIVPGAIHQTVLASQVMETYLKQITK